MKKERNCVVLVDGKDNVLGYKECYEAHKNPVPLHRAVSVLIFSPDAKGVLIQKRASSKLTWPGFWSNTVCSHPYKNEDYTKTAVRRLREEMGFSANLKMAFKFTYEVEMQGGICGEHELDTVFVGKHSGIVNPDTKEVADYKWMKIDDLKNDMKDNPENYTPWFKLIMKKLVWRY